jgi:hypothetical protein
VGDSITFPRLHMTDGSELNHRWTRDSIFNEITFDEPKARYTPYSKTHPVIGVTTFNEFTNFISTTARRALTTNSCLDLLLCGQNSSPFICAAAKSGEEVLLLSHQQEDNRQADRNCKT